MDKPIIKRGLSAHKLPRSYNGSEAWFYANRTSIDLVSSGRGHTVIYRLKLRDMKRIVKALSHG